MRAPTKLVLPTVAASLLLAACGSSSSSSTAARQPAKAQNASLSTGPPVKTASNGKLGTVLVNARGLTLYHLTGEQNGTFICTSAACVHAWHPVIATGSAPHGAVSSLTTVKRPDGTAQIAYQGMPLYTFVKDTAPGQDNGQGLQDVGTWTAVSPHPSASTTPAPAPATSSSGGGHAY